MRDPLVSHSSSSPGCAAHTGGVSPERGGAAPEPWPRRAGAVEGAEAGRVAREGHGGPRAVPGMDDL